MKSKLKETKKRETKPHNKITNIKTKIKNKKLLYCCKKIKTLLKNINKYLNSI